MEFLSIAQQVPALVDVGDAPVSAAIKARASQLAQGLRTNEWHALVEPDGTDVGSQIHYRVLRFAEMLALREAGQLPPVIAATTLVCDPSGMQLLMQKRSASSHLFPNYLSVLGGGFNPARDGEPHDNDDLRTTATREAFEEAAIHLTLPIDTWVAITRETDTGAVQANFLGVRADITSARAEKAEGELQTMPVPSKDQVAHLPHHTDLAKACLYAWRVCCEGL
ncbi:NUDIX hydrolase [Simiduia aestuariiviva]|uniref:8-oxo-dGTP pyrophosphatase MutT (NUDIX family) n=1 Tax=Simiduia aestuariiviva TaxID=1510459 RepID=A0A839UP00_9GAMM|nr:NUDIX hydrolase [Simiduia aestuariiviva]MBB3167167.1 8-oxo-dGTP pyrophosphatase MutT (NUDIX family) [Simiduia aestuariiviva]